MKIISEEVGDVEMTMPPRQDFELPEAVCEATIAVAAAPAFVDHTVSDEFIRHVSEAYTISVVRTRTVTALEFFWNIYSVFKSIITTFLGLPGVSMALSTVGANEIMNIPGADHCLTLFENFMSMILLVGSKPGFKVALLDKDGNVTYEARGVQPKPKTCMTMLFPAGRHIRIPFNDPAGNTIFSYDMPKKPFCGKRKGAKVVSGAVEGKVDKARTECGEIKVLGNAAKPSFCDNIAKLRKVASKGKSCQIRIPYFFTWSGWPNKGQPFMNPYVEIQPAGAGIAISKGLDSTKMVAQAQAAAPAAAGELAPGSPPLSPTAASRMAGMMKGLPNFWMQVPFPIIASTVAMIMGAADDLGLGDMVEAAANIKDSTSTGSGTGGPPKDVEAAASAARDALKMSGGIRMRNILTQRCRLHVKGEMIREYPLEQRLDIIAGMLWLDYSYLQKIIV